MKVLSSILILCFFVSISPAEPSCEDTLKLCDQAVTDLEAQVVNLNAFNVELQNQRDQAFEELSKSTKSTNPLYYLLGGFIAGSVTVLVLR